MLSVRGEACPVYVFLDAHDDFPAHRVAFLRRSISRFHLGLVPFRLFLSSHAVSLLLACPQGLLFSLGVVRGQPQGFDLIERIVKLAVGNGHYLRFFYVVIGRFLVACWFCRSCLCHFLDFVMVDQFANGCLTPNLSAILLSRLHCLLPRCESLKFDDLLLVFRVFGGFCWK